MKLAPHYMHSIVKLIIVLALLTGCSRHIVVVPDDHHLIPVYDAKGNLVENRYGISGGWLQEIIADLSACEGALAPHKPVMLTDQVDRG